MKYRKVIGWLLFALSIPFSLVAVTVSKEITGNMTIGVFVAALVVGGGWFLAHPKKKDEEP